MFVERKERKKVRKKRGKGQKIKKMLYRHDYAALLRLQEEGGPRERAKRISAPSALPVSDNRQYIVQGIKKTSTMRMSRKKLTNEAEHSNDISKHTTY